MVRAQVVSVTKIYIVAIVFDIISPQAESDMLFTLPLASKPPSRLFPSRFSLLVE